VEILESRIVLAAPDVDLSTLLPANGGNGSIGVTLFGAGNGDESGRPVQHIGDVNGDGFDDLLIGAGFADAAGNAKTDAGESYVVFGNADWSASPTLDLTTLNGTNGFTLFGIDVNDRSGNPLSGAGDVNGDGFDDLLIGAYGGDAAGNTKYNAGESYVVFGKADWSATPTLDLATLNGTNGFTLFGIDVDDNSGHAVSGAGDVNGDGFDDLLIGARRGDAAGNAKNHAGESYVVFGKADWSATPTLELSTLNGINGFTLFGVNTIDYSGCGVSEAGDVNGDGFDDLLIGAYGGDAAGNAKSSAGESYVVFGKADWSASSTLELSTLNGTNGFTLFGIDGSFFGFGGDVIGKPVSGAGDVNGDGFDDLLIGASSARAEGNAKANAGESYVIFGKADWSATSTLDLATLNGTNGFTLFGVDANDTSGEAVSGAGDVNGDGFDDLLIGAGRADAAGNAKMDAGESYVVFGKADWSATPTLDLATLNGTDGFTLFGADAFDNSGVAVSVAGDVNGDGFDDLLIGAINADAAGNAKSKAGESYVVFGGDFTNAVTHLGTANADTLTGTSGANVINGRRGNDTLVGNGGADVLYGGQGDDILAVSSTTFARIDGDNGADTLRLDGSGLTLNLTTLADNRVKSIEQIDITGSGNNTLTLNQLEVLNLSGNSNTLLVRRNAGDIVNIGGGWTQGANQTIGPDTFEVFTQGAATLKVQFDSAPSLSIAATSATKAEGNSGNTSFSFTVTRSGDASAAASVSYSVTGSSVTPANAADFGGAFPNGTVSFAANETSNVITINVTGDTLMESNEGFTVTLSNATNGVTISSATATGTIEDDDGANLTIAATSATKAEGNSGNTSFTFTVTRSGNTSGATTVSYAVTGSGATLANAADFGGVFPSGTVSFAANETSNVITINVTGDTLAESDDGFTVTLSNATNGATITTATAAGTIQDDDAPFTTFTVTNTNDSGSGSLRQALLDANATAGRDRIQFSIGSGARTISPASALPLITEAVVIDATTQPGFAGQPLIELDGTNAGNTEGLRITAGNSVVRGLVIGGFEQSGIVLADRDNNVVEGNYIGTNALGTVAHGNDFGVRIDSGSAGNRIGTDGDGVNDAAEMNLLSGNRADGVLIKDVGSDNNSVAGNLIGTNPAGTTSLSNNHGVRIDSGAKGNRVGTNSDGVADAAERNVISGNRLSGVLMIDVGTDGNLVAGNYIGTDVTGMVALANSEHGVILLGQAKGNRIGTNGDNVEDIAERNVIAGNGYDGVFIADTGTDGNVVAGNFIGVDASGATKLANNYGVRIDNGAKSNLIGTDANGVADLAERNVISGNRNDGVLINAIGTSNNTIAGNYIGVNATGLVPVGNSWSGVAIINASNNLIGGRNLGAGNVLSNNGFDGVAILSGTGNGVLGNSISSNGRLGIELKPDGVTLNDVDDSDSGPNNLQNFPVLSGASGFSTSTQILGTLNSSASSQFQVDFFASDVSDGTGFGEGRQYLGTTTVTTNGSGTAGFNVTLPVSVPVGSWMTCTATDGSNNTSEFSQAFRIDFPPALDAIGDKLVNEGSLLTFTASATDPDGPSDTLTFKLEPGAPAGAGVNSSTGVFSWTPSASQGGAAYTISVTVTDSGSPRLSASQSFLVTVNDTPTISNITDRSTNEDTATGAIGFTVGDIETAAGSLTVTVSSSNTGLVPNANLVLGGSGANRTLTVTPADNQSGTATITVTVSDGAVSSNDTFVLTVNAVNDTPTISDIADRSTNEDTATGAIDFTVGDIETTAGSLTVTASSSNTTLVPNVNLVLGGSGANRTLTVTPAANQSGTATITVTVSDGVASSNDTFVLTVNAVNDTPTISNITDRFTNEGTVPATIDFTVGDVETSAGSLTVTASSSNTTLVPNVNLVLGASGANRTLTVTPAANQSGTVTVTVAVSDGVFTASDTFLLTVNAVPTISDITDQSTNEDAATGAIGFTVGDSETAAGSLTVTASSSNTTLVPNVNLVLGGSEANRTLTVTPIASLSGTATVTITVSDGAASSNDTFLITVNGLNDPPVNSVPGPQTTNDENPVTFSSAQGNAITFSDLDAGSADVRLTLLPISGSIQLPTQNGLTLVQGDGSAGVGFTFDGTLANLNAALNGLQFRPTTDFHGTATLQITLNDLGNSGSGGSLSDTDTVNILVNDVNDAPVNSVPGTQTVSGGGSKSFNTANSNRVSITDVDARDGSLRVVLTAINGTLSLGSTSGLSFLAGNGTRNSAMSFLGTLVNLNSALSNLTLFPNASFSGSASFTMTTDDQGNSGAGGALSDTDTVFLTVTENSAPVLDISGTPYLIAPAGSRVAAEMQNGILITDLLARGAEGNPVTDPDAGAVEGIALTAVNKIDGTFGTWEFTLAANPQDADWTNVEATGVLSDSSALLLPADANARLRFVTTLLPRHNSQKNDGSPATPAQGFLPLETKLDSGLTFRAWDQTVGTSGGRANTTTNGGTTAFSTTKETAGTYFETRLFRSFNAAAQLNTYTLEQEFNALVNVFGYQDRSTSDFSGFTILMSPIPGVTTAALYRMYFGIAFDSPSAGIQTDMGYRYLTTNLTEVNILESIGPESHRAERDGFYYREIGVNGGTGITGYIYATQQPGTSEMVQIYRTDLFRKDTRTGPPGSLATGTVMQEQGDHAYTTKPTFEMTKTPGRQHLNGVQTGWRQESPRGFVRELSPNAGGATGQARGASIRSEPSGMETFPALVSSKGPSLSASDADSVSSLPGRLGARPLGLVFVSLNAVDRIDPLRWSTTARRAEVAFASLHDDVGPPEIASLMDAAWSEMDLGLWDNL
jgi:hypothetical protein